MPAIQTELKKFLTWKNPILESLSINYDLLTRSFAMELKISLTLPSRVSSISSEIKMFSKEASFSFYLQQSLIKRKLPSKSNSFFLFFFSVEVEALKYMAPNVAELCFKWRTSNASAAEWIHGIDESKLPSIAC